MINKKDKIKTLCYRLFNSGNFIIIIGVLSILPFLVISIFNNPSADDFCYSNYARDLGYLGLQKEAYLRWTGRYFTTAIMGIDTLVSGSFIAYKLVPIILLLSFLASIYHLCSSVFTTLCEKHKVVLSFLITVLYLVQMPSPTQGFYWLAGAVTYQLSIILVVFLFSFLIKYRNTLKNKYIIVAMLLSVLVIGSNEVSLMFVNLIIGSIFVNSLITKRKLNYGLLILIVVILVCSIIVIFSPGSASRATTYPGNQQFLYSFLKTIKATKSNLGDWMPTILVALLVFFDFFRKNTSIKTPKIFNVKLLIPFLIVFSFPILGVFPVYYSLKWVPLRAVNLIYFFFLLGVIYLAFVLYYKLKSEQKNFLAFSKWTKYFLFVLIIIRLGGNNNVRVAYSDLLNGTAYKYDKELRNRYQTIQNSNDEILVFPELTFLPKTIFFEDIKTNPKHWINQCYKSYFNHKEIKLKSTNAED